MECGNTKFLVGLGLGSAIGALVYHEITSTGHCFILLKCGYVIKL